MQYRLVSCSRADHERFAHVGSLSFFAFLPPELRDDFHTVRKHFSLLILTKCHLEGVRRESTPCMSRQHRCCATLRFPQCFTLCTCVIEYHRNGVGEDLQDLSRLSLDTQRREVSGVHCTVPTDIHRKPHVNFTKKSSGHGGIFCHCMCSRT